ncbi:sulfite exporter TauE/SafE family protein [Ramlibacter tataouinensis]|uniref:sulfite exporter TauE/SafE family protein n=1 Tax=Ramlibacter tataouinensis TaxID=94132 RepID=UPI0022F3B5F3|nr:sulfite exporter TauE/SafE family protein [Ramlibacter tataouinensis]WBY03951.1 sulfite exporter TauE/SafE family protein [Ramlibacter tataouinensis]
MLIYFATGAFVGFLAGLLGIGGGMTLVPLLASMFTAQQLAPDHVVHIALGTGMSSIVFTSSASVRAHHRLGGVDWSLVRRMGPGMVIGTLLATALSGWVSQRALALAFTVIVYAGATQLLLGRKPSAARTLPGRTALMAIGLLFGVVCGLVSAGGAFLTVPFMLFCGVSMTTAIGTGAALGLPVALIGTLGYVFSGWQVPGLPPLALGFVYGPALLGIVAGSVLTAPIGARAAHRLPVATLRRIFACLLYALATKMLWSYL